MRRLNTALKERGSSAASRMFASLVIVGAGALLPAPSAYAASCCGGGSGTALILPKFAKSMADLSLDFEKYDGFWNKDGEYVADPEGSDLRQYRLNVGVATRLGSRWQAGLVIPTVWNDNRYSGVSTQSHGAGDMSMNVWYETFDGIRCVSSVRSLKDLAPAAYLGAAVTIPTGISPYDDHRNSLDITGRGFYRLDGNVLVEKSIYPFNLSLALSYGAHLERPVNREYGKYVDPYQRKLGDKALGALSFGYSHLLRSLHTMTFALAYSHLWEDEGTLNGTKDPTTGLSKKGVAATFSYATLNGEWVIRSAWGHGMKRDGWGENFPATDIYTMGVSRVFH